MQRPLTQFTRKIDDLGEKIALRAIIAVAVIACIAAISNVRLGRETAGDVTPNQVTENLPPQTALRLLDANFTTEAFRSKVASPVEFAAVFGPSERSSVVASGISWPAAEAHVETKPAAARTRSVVVSACADVCETFSPNAILPPARPADVGSVQVVRAMTTSAEPEKQGLSFLGVSLSRFVPSGERIIDAVASLGSSITDLVLK